MTTYRSTALAVLVATGGLLATSSVASAQAKSKAPAYKPSPSVAVTANGGAWKRRISVSVLGGYSTSGTQLYYFPSPFDPLTGLFAPNRRIPIGPTAVGNGRSLWRAPTNSTTIGNFSPGQQLVFGLWLPGNKWLYSGAVNSQAVGLKQVTTVIPKSLMINNPSPVIAGTDYNYYGWAAYGKGSNPDYNEFVFATTQASVTPEPVTISMLGMGLFGIGGLGIRRRRKL